MDSMNESLGFALFNSQGAIFLLRWMHFFFGIVWIGLLYYFNFVQGAFMAEAEAAAKSNVTLKLVPRALWWFRWGAMWTMVTGVSILSMRFHLEGMGAASTSWGVCILFASLMALTMWANVWFVIWPNQKIVIQSATQVAAGQPALPQSATAAARALCASRTNVLFSIPMLFFMGAARNLPFGIAKPENLPLFWIVVLLVWGGIQFNALKGKTGPLTTIKGVITSGFALTIILYIWLETSLR